MTQPEKIFGAASAIFAGTFAVFLLIGAGLYLIVAVHPARKAAWHSDIAAAYAVEAESASSVDVPALLARSKAALLQAIRFSPYERAYWQRMALLNMGAAPSVGPEPFIGLDIAGRLGAMSPEDLQVYKKILLRSGAGVDGSAP